MFDRGLVAWAVQRMLVWVVFFCDASARKREMPVMPTMADMFCRDREWRVLDLSTRLLAYLDPAAYE